MIYRHHEIIRVVVWVPLIFALHAVAPVAAAAPGPHGVVVAPAPSVAPRSASLSAVRQATATLGETGLERDIPSQTIHKLQSLLHDLGAYNGPTNGVWSASLLQAMRRYLRRSGRTAEPKLTEDVLRRIERILERDLLIRRLDEEARRRKAVARKALLSQPQTRQLVTRNDRGEDARIADPTRDSTPCFRKPSAACLLHEATESAKAENRTELRDWAYGDIVTVLALAGLLTEAFETARLIEDPRKIVIALRHISEAQSANGDITSALNTVLLVPTPFQQVEGLRSILSRPHAAADRQAWERVLDQLEMAATRVTEPSQRVFVLAALAAGHQRHGGRVRADATISEARRLVIEGTSDATARAFGLSTIAEALTEMGRPNEALALLDEVEDQRERDPALVTVTAALALLGDSQRALSAAQAIEAPRYRALALADIAQAAAGRGDFQQSKRVLEQALATLRDVKVSYTRAFARSRISSAAASVLGAETAIDIAREIEQKPLRARTLWQIVVSRARAEDESGMQLARTEALAATAAIGSVIERTLVYSEAAIALFQMGRSQDARSNLKRALNIASSVTNPWSRAHVLTEAARAFAVIFR